MTTDFSPEHSIVAKRARMEELVARHNQLVSLVPKEVSQEVLPEVQMVLVEIDRNMAELLALVSELESDCAKSQYFGAPETIEARE